MPLHGRFLHGGGSCHIPFHVQGQSRLDGTLQFICTKGEYLFLWQAKNGMKQDTSAAKQSGKRENRPGVMPLGLWKRSFPIAKCSSMGRSAVTGYGGNRVFRTLKDTCFQERPTDGGRFWIYRFGNHWPAFHHPQATEPSDQPGAWTSDERCRHWWGNSHYCQTGRFIPCSRTKPGDGIWTGSAADNQSDRLSENKFIECPDIDSRRYLSTLIRKNEWNWIRFRILIQLYLL